MKAKKTVPPKNVIAVQFDLASKRVRVKPRAASMTFRIFDKADGAVMDLTDNELFQIVEFVQQEYPDVARRRRALACPACPHNKGK